MSGRADDDPEVTQFYVNPIAKPIPHGRAQPSLQDTISDLNMHKQPRNDLEVSRSRRSAGSMLPGRGPHVGSDLMEPDTKIFS